MNLFDWSATFETGLRLIDTQHRRLVERVNRLGELPSHQDHSLSEVSTTLDEPAQYAVCHLREEETLMDSQGGNERHRRSHRTEHEAFLLHVTSRIRELDPEDRDSGERIFDLLV